MESKNPQKQTHKSKAQKRQEKKESKDKRWRETVGNEAKYTEPHLCLDISKAFYPDYVKQIRDLLLNDEVVFRELGDGNEYLVIRLEISQEAEDGLLTFWRVNDVYLMVVGVVNHGFYYLPDKDEDKLIVEGAKPLRGVSYAALTGAKEIHVGVEAFIDAVFNLLEGIRSHNEDITVWGSLIGTMLLFLPEAVRNNFVLFNTMISTYYDESLWGPCGTLVNSWEACSKLMYEYNPEEDNGHNDKDLALIDKFVRRDSWELTEKEIESITESRMQGDSEKIYDIKVKHETELLEELKLNKKVLRFMLPVPWDYRAAKRYWGYIQSALSTHRSGMGLGAIEKHLKSISSQYTMPECQLKNVLWDLVSKGKLVQQNNLFTLPPTVKAKAKSIQASTSGGSAKQDLVLMLIGPNGRAKTNLTNTLKVYGSYLKTQSKRLRLIVLESDEMELPNLICRADIAILVIDSKVDEDILSYETIQHVLLARAFQKKLLVAVNMTISRHTYSKDSFKNIKSKLSRFLEDNKIAGTKFIPIEGEFNGNISSSVNSLFCDWSYEWSCECLFDALDLIEVVHDKNLPLRMPVVHFEDEGRQVVGKIECGDINVGDTLLIMPAGVKATVNSILIGGDPVMTADAGQIIEVQLEKIEEGVITCRSVLCSNTDNPIPKVRQFRAQMWVEQDSAIDGTFTLRMHSIAVKVRVVGDVQSKHGTVQTLSKDRKVQCLLEVEHEIYMEPFATFKQFGKFVVMNEEGELIAAGIVLELSN